MHFKKTILLGLAMALSACGGGGESKPSSGQSQSQAEPPSLSVAISAESITLEDGQSVKVPLQVTNTTGTNVKVTATVADGTDHGLSFAVVGNELNVTAKEINSVKHVQNIHIQLQFKASNLSEASSLTVEVVNDELGDFIAKKRELEASRLFKGPLNEMEAITSRYLIQAEILGYITASEHNINVSNLKEMRESYIEQAVSDTQSVMSRYVSNTPSTDEAALSAISELSDALAIFDAYYIAYYEESNLVNLLSFELGLPDIVSPVASYDDYTARMTILHDESYGHYSSDDSNTSFAFAEEYDFLQHLDTSLFCNSNDDGAL